MQLSKRNLLICIGLAVAALLFYYPIINNTFLSDDYDSLYRISVEKRILFKEFLRPLIDVSFYLNYLISGLDPWSYYVFNLIIHLVAAFLLYRFALSFTLFDDQWQKVFATASAFLFMIYPFHNESIVWLTGRLSSMATLSALVVMNIWVSSLKQKQKLIFSGLIYFIGLLAYESILLLPIILAILSIKDRFFTIKNFRYFFFAIGIIAATLLVRFLISGVVYGNYGERMVIWNWDVYVSRALKTFGRSMLPPSESEAFMKVGFGVFIALILYANFKTIKAYRLLKSERINYLKLLTCFLFAMFIPMLFGISTRTSEGDRLLYFPSLFLCMLLSFWGLLIIKAKFLRLIYFFSLFSYFICFLILNNKQWEKASNTVSAILEAINESKHKTVYLINVPDELEGAYVFRNGFQKCLVLKNYDSSKVCVVNYLTRLEYLNLDTTISSISYKDYLAIPPFTQIQNKGDGTYQLLSLKKKQSFLLTKQANSVYYWNQHQLVRLL